jgi:hypothetical protein
MFCTTIAMLETIWCHVPNYAFVWNIVHQNRIEILELFGSRDVIMPPLL